jgi:hypothetical protein
MKKALATFLGARPGSRLPPSPVGRPPRPDLGPGGLLPDVGSWTAAERVPVKGGLLLRDGAHCFVEALDQLSGSDPV